MGASVGLSTIDPTDAFCRADTCLITTEKRQPIYNDDGYFNPAWSIDNAAFIDRTLAPTEQHGDTRK